jgi:hypothetical protein
MRMDATMKRRRVGAKVAMLMAVAAIGLGGCSEMKSSGVDPIDWYRDLSGISADDTKDQAPNSKNLAEGSKEPYPNLASVPKLPDNAITKADREKIAQSLVADRQNAQYTDEQLHAGQNMAAIPPPSPEPRVAAGPASKPAAPTPVPASKVAAAPASAPKIATAPVKQEVLPPPAAPAPKVATASPQVPPEPKMAQTASAPQVAQTTPPRPQAAPKKKADDAKKKQATVKRGSEKQPEESALRAPTLGAMPAGEEARTPPPAPSEARHVKTRPARTPRPEELAAAAPSRSDVEAANPRGNAAAQTVEISFAPGPFRARILPAAHKQLVDVAKIVERNNGRVRVVGYGGAPAQGDAAQREFQAFNAALDNAKAVGVELAKLGVPPNRIDIETAANVNSPDRAEVFVEY